MKDQELEVKYLVKDLKKLEEKTLALGGKCVQPRTQEINLRFDTSDHLLSKQGKALRLRYDTKARMTFKGLSQSEGGARLRQEIEFVVEDFQAASSFLVALGFQISMIYEKYRTAYDLGGVQIMLDELPFGHFVEIEGPSAAEIHAINDQLGLDWNTRVPASYTVLFDELKLRKDWDFRDLVFENFRDRIVSAEDLQVRFADQ